MYENPMYNPDFGVAILSAKKRLHLRFDPVRDARAFNIRADLAATVNREVGCKRQEEALKTCEIGVGIFFFTAIVGGLFAPMGNPMVFGVIEVIGLAAFLISSWIACLIIDPPTIIAIARYREAHPKDMQFLAGLPDVRHPFDDELDRWPSRTPRLCFL